MAEKIGKYEIVRKIGRGGFGDVYEGLDPEIQRRVAIKTCLTQSAEARARFIQEARLAGNLHHRNVTTLYDFGSEGERLYLVCEFLPGEDLDALIERGKPLSIQEKIEILIGIAYGLGHAHDAGIVHRDVKPGNVRVLPDGTVKIMDFGVAKFLYAERTLTRSGVTVGTSFYLAPEQVRGESVDRRSDIFSFGVLAYELLSSRKPFTGSSQAEILDAIAKHDPPRLGDVAPDIPPALAVLVEKAMRKDPAERYPSLEPVRRGLLAIREELAAPASRRADERSPDLAQAPLAHPALPPKAGRSRGWLIAVAVVVTLLLACGLLFLLTA